MQTFRIIKIILSILFLIIFSKELYSQIDSCRTVTFPGETTSGSSFIGGIYKPHRTDIGGSPSDQELDYFPILVVFIQYQGEIGGNFPGNPDSVNAWPAGRAPNYMNKVISDIRAPNSSSWWDSYNGYEINDYWHEFSRGKLHIQGEAFSVILPHTFGYYDSLPGGIGRAKMNKDVFDYLSDSVNVDWPFYDKWKTTSNGHFSWEKDELVDMIYMVFRSKTNAFLGSSSGVSDIGYIDTNGNYLYTVYQSGNTIVKVNGSYGLNGSGQTTDARGDLIYSRHKFLDVSTHEHLHYLFGSGHNIYCHLAAGSGWEFSLSPWEVVKLGYVQQKYVNYSNPSYILYDYSSRTGSAGSAGEVLQIPVSSDGKEFFLLANRSKLSEWGRRMSRDILADDGYQSLKNINPNYGKGLYIYHITNGYSGHTARENDRNMDLECADGLWNWVNTGLTRPPTWDPNSSHPVYKKVSPSYKNDSNRYWPYRANMDEMSFFDLFNDKEKSIWFSPGSRDQFNPLRRGTDKLYTNDNDYWFSLAVLGDRWDAWNVGYNEVFSPYSSPNTKDITNTYTGIFIWYYTYSGSGPSGFSKLKIYRTGEAGLSEESILHLTPPSRPMGINVDYYTETENYIRPIITWNHNQEPDMLRPDSLKKRYYIWRAVNQNMTVVPVDYSLLDTVDIASDTVPSYIDHSVFGLGSSWPGMGQMEQYPLRYTVQAVDKYEDVSVRSDFGMAIGIKNCTQCIGVVEDHLMNDPLPAEYSLNQNFPNPFNPDTKIQYALPEDNYVTIKIYDVLGKEVITLINELKSAGRYNVTFNGESFSSGIYYYKIDSGNFSQVRKMILIR